MPPKKATTAAPKKASGTPAHANYKDMIKDAILTLKERNGSSRQAIKKYIKANNNLGDITDNMFTAHFNRALKSGQESGDFEFPKGVSGRVKLAKKDAAKKPAAAKKASPPPAKETKKPAAKSATKKASTTKAAPKKAAAPKEKKAAAKAPTKKAAAKPKANASKPRKAATAAPAVEDKPAVVLGKTKSGRVTKTKAPVTPAKTARKPAAKKVSSAKKPTPKKSATPKKAEA